MLPRSLADYYPLGLREEEGLRRGIPSQPAQGGRATIPKPLRGFANHRRKCGWNVLGLVAPSGPVPSLLEASRWEVGRRSDAADIGLPPLAFRPGIACQPRTGVQGATAALRPAGPVARLGPLEGEHVLALAANKYLCPWVAFRTPLHIGRISRDFSSDDWPPLNWQPQGGPVSCRGRLGHGESLQTALGFQQALRIKAVALPGLCPALQQEAGPR